MLKRKKGKGFSLIELLIVVAIIGIIAAIAIPNLLSAIQKGRQKRTMGDMKSLGTAVETVQTDCSAYPDVTAVGKDCSTAGSGTLAEGLLKGGWLQNPILCDGWRALFQYGNAAATGGTTITISDVNCTDIWGTTMGTTYGLLSKGRDATEDCDMPTFNSGTGTYESSGSPCTGASTCAGHNRFDCDISFAGGQFVAFPEGMQK